MTSLTLYLLAIGGLLLSRRLVGDFFTPPAIYNFFWAFALGTLELGWVSYDPLRYGVWLVIGVSYLGFMSGSFLIALYAAGKNRWLVAPAKFEHLDRGRFELILKIMFAIGIFGFVVQLAHLQMQLGLGTFISAPSEARELHTNVKYLGFFNLLNVSNFVLALMYLVLYKKPSKWVVLMMLWAVATTFLTTDRTRFFYMVIWSFYIAAYCFRHIRINPRIIMAGVSTVALLLGFFMLVAVVYKKQAYDDNMEYVNVGEELAPLIDPYIYLTGSFPVLQAFLDDQKELHYGQYTFGPVVKLMEVFTPDVERAELVGKFYRVPIELNACTYLELFYKDFGLFGVFVGPLILGLLAMIFYVNMRQSKTVFSVYLTALMSFCVTISIFSNHFTQIATWFFVAVGYMVYRFSFTSESQPKEDFRELVYQ